jgi:hypothetical protein
MWFAKGRVKVQAADARGAGGVQRALLPMGRTGVYCVARSRAWVRERKNLAADAQTT